MSVLIQTSCYIGNWNCLTVSNSRICNTLFNLGS